MKTNRQAQTNVSRRTFLKTVAGMAAVWSTKILGVPFAWGAEAPDVSVSSNFGRMFHLPPFAQLLIRFGKHCSSWARWVGSWMPKTICPLIPST